jgi:hypothetical protein
VSNSDADIDDQIAGAVDLVELAAVLEQLLSSNLAVWEDGELYHIKKLVAEIHGLRIEIYHNEHPPPHFHVKAPGIAATFDIRTCELLQGKIPRREQRLVGWWHARARSQLVRIWNSTRPTDCPVGPIDEAAA